MLSCKQKKKYHLPIYLWLRRPIWRPKGKKYSKKKFKELLLSIQDLPMNEQRGALYESHINWRGANEQVDDICVIGVRV